jgi:tetratricopeptide (TPR) repeat protein
MRSQSIGFNFYAPLIALSFYLVAAALVCGQGRSVSTATRSITIVTEPASTVWIDGVRYGTTDDKGRLEIASALPGIRSLRVRAPGFAEVTRSLPAATRGELAVKLVKTTDEAELAFQSAEAQTTIDREKAIAEYRRAIKLRANYPDAYLGLARAFSERGDIEEAHKAIQSAKRLRPANAEVTAVEGRVLKDGGEGEKAIAAFKRAIVLGKGFQPEAHTGLGLLYKDRAENSGGSGDYEGESANYDESAKHFAIAVQQLGSAPDAIIVYQLLGLIYERQKKYKEAIALYEEFLRLFPNSSEAGAVESFIVQIKKQMSEPK